MAEPLLPSPMNSTSTCSLPMEFWAIRAWIYFLTYYALIPIFFVLGLLGHSLCILALRRQSRKEPAYMYQIYVEISEVSELIAFAVYTLSIKWWSGAEDLRGVVWYRDSYALMWFAARLATPISNVFITTSLLLSLSMAIDRTLALCVPHSYKTWNRKRQQIGASTICVLLGVSTTVFAMGRYRIRERTQGVEGVENGKFEIYIDEEYASSAMANILSNIRNVVRTVGVIALIACNATIVCKYRAHVARTYDGKRPSSEPAANQELGGSASRTPRHRTEQMLTVMAIVESTTTAIGMLALTSYFLIIFTEPSFTNCGGLLMIPIVDVVLLGSNIAKFFIIAGVNRKFRGIVIGAMIPRLRWKSKCSSSEMRLDSSGGLRVEQAALTSSGRC